MTEWIVEAVIQFMRSPMWTTPVQNFIDTKCIGFDNDDEMKLEYTTVHKEFQQLIEDVLEAFLTELGIDGETLVSACEEHRERDPKVAKFLQYLLTLDDFTSFYKMMVRRNVELETEAMEAWARMQSAHASDTLNAQQQQPETKQPPEAVAAPEAKKEGEEEEKEISVALEASLRASELIMKQAELEDAELQQALAMSLAEEQDRIRREEKKREEEREKADHEEKERQAKLAAEERAKAEEEAKIRRAEQEAKEAKERTESEERMKAMERTALEARVKNIEKAKEDVAQAEVEGKRASEVPVKPKVAPEDVGPAVLHKSLTIADADDDSASKELKALSDVGHRRGFFGQKSALPDLAGGPISFNDLHRKTTPLPSPQDATSATMPTKVQSKKEEEERAKAEMEARAKYMRDQRNKLIEQRTQARDDSMKSYAEEQGLSPAVSPAGVPPPISPGVDVEHREMTRALLRRFKEDIIQESVKEH